MYVINILFNNQCKVLIYKLLNIYSTNYFILDILYMKTKNDYLNFYKKFYKDIDDLKEYFKDCDFYQFELDELMSIGWGNWGNNLKLIPDYFYSCIPHGMRVKCVNGGYFTCGIDYIDDDTRMGFLSYGLTQEMLDEYKIENRNKIIDEIIDEIGINE